LVLKGLPLAATTLFSRGRTSVTRNDAGEARPANAQVGMIPEDPAKRACGARRTRLHGRDKIFKHAKCLRHPETGKTLHSPRLADDDHSRIQAFLHLRSAKLQLVIVTI